MQTKDYLAQIRTIDRRIANKMREAQKWRELAYCTGSSSNMNENKVQTSKRYDRMGDAVSIGIDAEKEAKEVARRLAIVKYTIEKQISEVPTDKYYQILHAFYVDGLSITQIMQTQFYSKSHAYEVYNAALVEFEEKYGAEYLTPEDERLKKSQKGEKINPNI